MTIVIARKFGDRIIVAADTMVSSYEGSHPEALPGHLKAIVLDGKLSVAYSGLLHSSLDAVRHARTLVQRGSGLSAIYEYLSSRSANGDCDFLVASHYAGPELRKVTNGAVSADVSVGWIGDPRSLKHFIPKDTQQLTELPDFLSKEELLFTSGFLGAFTGSGTQISNGVGGVPVLLLGSPHGHCYNGYAFATAWDTIDLAKGVTSKQMDEQKAGRSEWRVHGCDPVWRGVAVYGVYLEQPSIGFLYDPLQMDDTEKYVDISYEKFGATVKERAGRAQGAFEEEGVVVLASL